MRNLLLILFFCTGIFSSCGDDDPSIQNITSVENEILQLINNHRQNLGLSLLSINDLMASEAQKYAREMAAADRLLFSEGFGDRGNAVKDELGNGSISENEASYQGENPAQGIFDIWLGVLARRAEIEGNYDFTGIGVAQGVSGTYYGAQLFWKG